MSFLNGIYDVKFPEKKIQHTCHNAALKSHILCLITPESATTHHAVMPTWVGDHLIRNQPIQGQGEQITKSNVM